MQIVTPRVVQYSDAEECMEDPTAQVLDGEDAYDKPVQYVLLTYKPSQF